MMRRRPVEAPLQYLHRCLDLVIFILSDAKPDDRIVMHIPRLIRRPGVLRVVVLMVGNAKPITTKPMRGVASC
jgi:hypothetical protein